MRRLTLSSIIAVTALAFCALTLTSAEARKRGKKKYYGNSNERALTVRKRSFLDSGTTPLPGETNRYVIQHTHHNVLPYSNNDMYGGSVLPGRLGPFAPR